MTRTLLLLIIALLLLMPVSAQEGRGVIVIGVPGGIDELTRMIPTQCTGLLCEQLNTLLLPTFQAVDPSTGAVIPAALDNYGLVASVEFTDARTAVFTLRDDLTWNDGTPITAYDVFYSYLSALPNGTTGAVPLDGHHIAVLYPSADCAALDRTVFPVVPALDPGFAPLVANFFTDDDLQDQFLRWFTEKVYPTAYITYADLTQAGLSAGPYRVHELRPMESLRLQAVEGTQGIVFTALPGNFDRVEYLLQGGLTLVHSPPYNRRADLLARSELQTAMYPSRTVYAIIFNLADPHDPLPAFDSDSGDLLDQGHHPVLADPAVRRAIQHGIDVQALIDLTANGSGTPLGGMQLPSSWAANPDLTPPLYDPGTAMRLLEDAGWRDGNRDGLRECIRCDYAEVDQPLAFSLMADNTLQPTAAMIQRQLRLLGIHVNVMGVSQGNLNMQTFDAYLTTIEQVYPYTPDRTGTLTRSGDVLRIGENFGSYFNPRVDELMEQARTVPDCDLDARASLYQEIEALLAEDLPQLWLFSPDVMIVAQDSVQGFDPLPYAPYWNIDRWTITRQERES